MPCTENHDCPSAVLTVCCCMFMDKNKEHPKICADIMSALSYLPCKGKEFFHNIVMKTFPEM
jgi:hypothetical protein